MSIAAKLIHLGFISDVDFSAKSKNGVEWFDWYSAQPQPTQETLDAITDQQIIDGIKARKDSAEPDLAALRDQAMQAVADINTFLAIANPSNAQVLAEVRAIDQRQRAIIKAIARLAVKAI